jgi:hypothetical protein
MKAEIHFYNEMRIIQLPQTLYMLRQDLTQHFGLENNEAETIIISYEDTNGELMELMKQSDYRDMVKYGMSLHSSKKIRIRLLVREIKEFIQTREIQQKNAELLNHCKELSSCNKLREEKIFQEEEIRNKLKNKCKEDNERLRKSQESHVIEKIKIELKENLRKSKIKQEDEFSLDLSKLITKNLEIAKEEIIKKTVTEATKLIEQIQHQEIQNSSLAYNSRLLKSISKIEHKNIKCHDCGISPIIGCRYKCTICKNMDFCQVCEEKNAEHGHPFIKIREPDREPLNIVCMFKEEEQKI